MNRAKKIMNDKQKQKPRRTSGGGSGLEMKFEGAFSPGTGSGTGI